MNNKIRIGIIGCSRIAKNSTIPAILKSRNTELAYIGSRSENKAKTFASEFGCKNFGSYDDVIHSSDIDAVYISTPVGTHEQWAVKAANAGKHILCEKSSTSSYMSAKNMIRVCKKNNVRIMEAFMFRFHPSHQKVKKLISDNKLGNLFSFYGMYGFPPIQKNDIRYNKSLGGGVLNDAGCYMICAARMLFDSEPDGVLCNLIIDKKTNVDTKATIFMNFSQGRFSQSVVGYDLLYQSVYTLWGSEGLLSLRRAFNVPPDMPVTLDIDTNNFKKKISIKSADHFYLMINSFSNELKNPGNLYFNFENELLNQAKIMEAARISNTEQRYVKINEVK